MSSTPPTPTQYAHRFSRGLSYLIPTAVHTIYKALLKQLPSAARPIYAEYFRDLMASKACAAESAAAMAQFVGQNFPGVRRDHNRLARMTNREIEERHEHSYVPVWIPIVGGVDEDDEDGADAGDEDGADADAGVDAEVKGETRKRKASISQQGGDTKRQNVGPGSMEQGEEVESAPSPSLSRQPVTVLQPAEAKPSKPANAPPVSAEEKAAIDYLLKVIEGLPPTQPSNDAAADSSATPHHPNTSIEGTKVIETPPSLSTNRLDEPKDAINHLEPVEPRPSKSANAPPVSKQEIAAIDHLLDVISTLPSTQKPQTPGATDSTITVFSGAIPPLAADVPRPPTPEPISAADSSVAAGPGPGPVGAVHNAANGSVPATVVVQAPASTPIPTSAPAPETSASHHSEAPRAETDVELPTNGDAAMQWDPELGANGELDADMHLVTGVEVVEDMTAEEWEEGRKAIEEFDWSGREYGSCYRDGWWR